MPEADPIIPPWLALLGGAVCLVLLAGHILALGTAAEMDARRRRIRTANAALMMLVVPFIAYGFGIATPTKARAFVYVWVVTAALLFMIIFVAMIDMLHSWQVHRTQLREVRRQLALTRSLEARAATILSAGGPRTVPPEKPPDAAGR